jgi:uncharacterized protein with GYD domain
MATYVSLLKLTDRGTKDIKESYKRAMELRNHAKTHGIEIKEQLWCLGAYDGLLIFEAPDDETATAAMLSLGWRGNVTTETMRSFRATEMEKILGKIS